MSDYTIEDAKRWLNELWNPNGRTLYAEHPFVLLSMFIEQQAAEIERLRDENLIIGAQQTVIEMLQASCKEKDAEIERLRKQMDTYLHNDNAIQRATLKDRDHYKKLCEQGEAEIERLRGVNKDLHAKLERWKWENSEPVIIDRDHYKAMAEWLAREAFLVNKENAEALSHFDFTSTYPSEESWLQAASEAVSK